MIRWKDHGGEQHFSARAYVDGVRIRGKICQPRAGGARKGVRISADAYRAFQFADLQTTGAPPHSLCSLLRPETQAVHCISLIMYASR